MSGHGDLGDVVGDIKRQCFRISTISQEFDVVVTPQCSAEDIVVIIDPSITRATPEPNNTVGDVRNLDCRTWKQETARGTPIFAAGRGVVVDLTRIDNGCKIYLERTFEVRFAWIGGNIRANMI